MADMKLAVYRLKQSGKIKSIQKVDHLPGIETLANKYNDNPAYDNLVEIVELQEDSLEMFLFNRAEVSIKGYKDEIEDIQSTLDDISNRIDCLINQEERRREVNG